MPLGRRMGKGSYLHSARRTRTRGRPVSNATELVCCWRRGEEGLWFGESISYWVLQRFCKQLRDDVFSLDHLSQTE